MPELRFDPFEFILPPGEKLSKQQLQHSNIIKKLRAKEKESEAMITRQSKKLKEQEEELKQLQQVREECLLICGIILILEKRNKVLGRSASKCKEQLMCCVTGSRCEGRTGEAAQREH